MSAKAALSQGSCRGLQGIGLHKVQRSRSQAVERVWSQGTKSGIAVGTRCIAPWVEGQITQGKRVPYAADRALTDQ